MTVVKDHSERLIRRGPERRTQLPVVWSLPSPAPWDPGVSDVEHLCRAVLVESLKRYHMPVSDQDFQDALAHLLGEVAVLHAGYVVAPGRELGPFLYQRLRLRLIDHWRKWYGRDGRHRLPSFDEPAGDDEGELDDGSRAAHRPAGAHADPTDDWLADLGWVHAVGDRAALGETGGMGLGAGDEPTNGDRRAGAQATGRATARIARAPRIAPFVDCPGCGWREYVTAPNGTGVWHYAECSACGQALDDEHAEAAAA